MRCALGLAALGLVACIDAQLVPCGDEWECPSTKICHEGACLYPDQLTACGADPDATPCKFTGTDAAVCVGAICQPLGCGNKIVTPDEICDDGNNVNGDGCSADCKSNEACGNGLADFATGEQCDDGNQIDDDGCRNDCTLPRCGDGQIDKFEQCDPGSTAPLTATCVDLNFDLGVLTCSPTCIFDAVESCEHYGWQLVRDFPYGSKLAGVQGTLVVLPQLGGAIEIRDATGITTHDGSYVDIDMVGTTIAAATGSGVDLRLAGIWTPLPAPPIPANTAIVQVVLDPAATPLVLVRGTGGCQVDIFDGAWSTVAEPSTCTKLVVDTKTNFVVATSDPAIQWTTGAQTISRATSETVMDVRFQNSIAVIESSYANIIAEQLDTVGGGPTIMYALGSYQSTNGEARVIGKDNLVYGMMNAEFDGKAHRANFAGSINRVEDFGSAPNLSGAPRSFYKTHDSHLYADGSEKLWRLGQLARTERTYPSDSAVLPIARFALAPDGTFFICGNTLWQSSANGWLQDSAVQNGQCIAMYVASQQGVYAAREPGGMKGLYYWGGATWTEQRLPGSIPMAAASIAGSGNTVYAILESGAAVRGQAFAWTTLDPFPAGCTGSAVAVNGAIVIAAGQCSGASTIWQLAGTSWIELHHETAGGALTQLYVAGDGTVFAATAIATIVGSGTTWQRYPNIGGQLAGTSASDVYAIQSGAGHDAWHWDGTQWSQLQLDPSLGYTAVLASPSDLVFVGAPFPAPVPITWVGFVRGP